MKPSEKTSIGHQELAELIDREDYFHDLDNRFIEMARDNDLIVIFCRIFDDIAIWGTSTAKFTSHYFDFEKIGIDKYESHGTMFFIDENLVPYINECDSIHCPCFERKVEEARQRGKLYTVTVEQRIDGCLTHVKTDHPCHSGFVTTLKGVRYRGVVIGKRTKSDP